MTVKELIEKLQSLPQNETVYIGDLDSNVWDGEIMKTKRNDNGME